MTSYTAGATPSRYYCDKSAYLSHVLLEGLLGLKASRVRRLPPSPRGLYGRSITGKAPSRLGNTTVITGNPDYPGNYR